MEEKIFLSNQFSQEYRKTKYSYEFVNQLPSVLDITEDKKYYVKVEQVHLSSRENILFPVLLCSNICLHQPCGEKYEKVLTMLTGKTLINPTFAPLCTGRYSEIHVQLKDLKLAPVINVDSITIALSFHKYPISPL